MASFCAACGNSIAEGERFCRVCGRDSAAASVAGPPNPAGPSVIPGASAETSGKAIVSLVSGLFIFFFPASIIAIIFGHLSLAEIRRSAGRLQGHGLAVAGLVLGYMGIAVIPVLIIAAIAIPNLLRARMAANESSAVAGIRTLITAEISYAANHRAAGFTCSLSDLSSDQLITSNLATGRQSGYAFELSNCAATASGEANAKFQVVAYPITPNQTGVRAFCSDESAVIKVDASGSAQGCFENGAFLQ